MEKIVKVDSRMEAIAAEKKNITVQRETTLRKSWVEKSHLVREINKLKTINNQKQYLKAIQKLGIDLPDEVRPAAVKKEKNDD